MTFKLIFYKRKFLGDYIQYLIYESDHKIAPKK